jgi:hypothetical protein
MFDRYVVVYGDWVAARREEKIKIEPWQRFYPSKEAAKEMISHFQDGHGTDVLWPRHYHDGDDVAAPPVVWADTPYGGRSWCTVLVEGSLLPLDNCQTRTLGL